MCKRILIAVIALSVPSCCFGQWGWWRPHRYRAPMPPAGSQVMVPRGVQYRFESRQVRVAIPERVYQPCQVQYQYVPRVYWGPHYHYQARPYLVPMQTQQPQQGQPTTP